MKIAYTLAAIVFITMCLTGCNSLFESTKGKAISMEGSVYGIKGCAFDPATGTMSPTGEVGFGSAIYRSAPIEAGQPIYIKETRYWLIGGISSETEIWIGRASTKGTLIYEAIPSTMVKISKKGVELGTTNVELIPAKAVK
jgi:hypothetical protein